MPHLKQKSGRATENRIPESFRSKSTTIVKNIGKVR